MKINKIIRSIALVALAFFIAYTTSSFFAYIYNPTTSGGGSGGGTVTSIGTSGSVTGGTITDTGTISLVNDNATPGNSQYYGTNSSGTKGYFAVPSGGTPGGLNAQLQYNNSGVFGGITGAVSDGTSVSLTGAHLLSPTINGAGTGLATLAYPNTAANATITFPSATGTLATITGAEALTNKSVNGVTVTTALSTSLFLNGAGGYTVPAGAISSVSASNPTLTISPTTGAVLAGINLASANTWSGAITYQTAITGAVADGFNLTNSTAATSGANAGSPTLHFLGNGWTTASGGASKTAEFRLRSVAQTGTTVPKGILFYESNIAGAGYNLDIGFGDTGEIYVPGVNPGSAGQALLSGGVGAAVTWGTPAISFGNGSLTTFSSSGGNHVNLGGTATTDADLNFGTTHNFTASEFGHFILYPNNYGDGFFSVNEAGVIQLGDSAQDLNGTAMTLDDTARQIYTSPSFDAGFLVDMGTSVTTLGDWNNVIGGTKIQISDGISAIDSYANLIRPNFINNSGVFQVQGGDYPNGILNAGGNGIAFIGDGNNDVNGTKMLLNDSTNTISFITSGVSQFNIVTGAFYIYSDSYGDGIMRIDNGGNVLLGDYSGDQNGSYIGITDTTGQFLIRSGLTFQPTVLSSGNDGYTVDMKDTIVLVGSTGLGHNFVLNLPDATLYDGRQVTIKNTTSGGDYVNVTAFTGQQIDGLNPATVKNMISITIIASGGNWWII